MRFSHRFATIQACEHQLLQFRSLSGSLLRWLQTAQDQLPSKDANLTTEGLQRRVQQLKVCAGLKSYLCKPSVIRIILSFSSDSVKCFVTAGFVE